MEWTVEKTLELIKEFKKHRILWDPNDQNYKRKLAWTLIDRKMQCKEGSSRKKMKSMIISFRRIQKHKTFIGIGAQKREVFETNWYGFLPMSFMLSAEDKLILAQSPLEMPEDLISSKEELNDLENDNDNIPALHYFTEKENNVTVTINSGTTNMTIESADSSNQNLSNFNDSCIHERCSDHHSILIEILKTVKMNYTDDDDDDEYSVFLEYLATKLRNYDKETRCIVQNRINQILFDADMGVFDA